MSEPQSRSSPSPARGGASRRFRLPNEIGVIAIPGFDGGGEWGGAAADPETGVLYVNANQVAAVVALEQNTDSETSGR